MLWIILGLIAIVLVILALISNPAQTCRGFEPNDVCACTRCSVPGRRRKY